MVAGISPSSPTAQPTPQRLPLEATPARNPVNWRSVLLGLSGVIFICGLTPYNNYVVNNSSMIGCHLPPGLLAFFIAFIMLFNAPLRKWAPRRALSGGELSVAMGMTLVSCALPAVGLMRYLPGHLVSPFYHAIGNADYRQVLLQAHLPDWIFPAFKGSPPWTDAGVVQRGGDPVVQYFIQRVPVEHDTFWAHWVGVPWRAWIAPTLTWGLFFAALFGAVICASIIVRRQWTENERLPFPLASIYLSLIETPAPGRAFNSLFARRSFWFAVFLVFFIRSANALYEYDPKHWPEIPVGYDFLDFLTEPPWSYTYWTFRLQQVYFTIIGLMYFIQSKVAFSLWFFYILGQIARMLMGAYGGLELTKPMAEDQAFGALIPFAVTIIWVGRQHFAGVLKQMIRGARTGEATGRYLPYAAAGWGLVICLSALALWLWTAGASPAGAIVIVLMLMLLYLVVARIVAETGLLYILIPVQLNRPFVYATNDLPSALTTRTTVPSYFWATFFSGVLTHDMRESLPVFSTHALRVADEAAYPNERNWRRGVPFVLALVLALAVAYVVSGASSLYCHYSYSATLDRSQDSPISKWGCFDMPRIMALDGTAAYLPPRTGPDESHNRLAHFALGAGVASFLSIMRLRFVSWPLHPVGFILYDSWGIGMTWLSIFIGWLLKVVIVRTGGSQLFRKLRPFFIGLIIGEAGAVAFWLSVSLVRLWLGMDYQAIQFLPV